MISFLCGSDTEGIVYAVPKSIATMYESPILETSRATQIKVKHESDQIQQSQCSYVIRRRCLPKVCHPPVSQTFHKYCSPT